MDLVGTRAVSYAPSAGALHLFDFSALDLPGWPAEIVGHVSSCLADIDGDGEVEIFAAGTIQGEPQSYLGFRLDGSMLPGWPVVATTMPFVPVTAPCTIGDIDGDGTFEVIGGTALGEVSVWNQDGSLLNGWPVVLPTGFGIPSVIGAAAVGDLDGDGTLEIVIAPQSGFVHVLRLDGTDFPGFPVNLKLWGGGAPALADVDGDGQLEIIVALRGGAPSIAMSRLYVLRANGALQPGFPRVVRDEVYFGAVVADLDQDGELSLIAAVDSTEQTLMAWDARSGEPREGFPIPNPIIGVKGVHASPTVGDITGDGYPDILLARFFLTGGGAMLFAWDRDGDAIQPYPLRAFPGFIVYRAAPTLTDLNDDGFIDVLPAEDELVSGRLHALTFNQPYDPRTLEWPTESHDARHTGLYEPPVDELRIWGRFNEKYVFLDEPPGRLTAKIWHLDRRSELSATLAGQGVSIAEINDRPVVDLTGEIVARPGTQGLGPSTSRPDLVVRFAGRAVAGAILERLRRAGVAGGEEREVRLKIESPLQDRRRIGGEVRLRVKMPVGG